MYRPPAQPRPYGGGGGRPIRRFNQPFPAQNPNANQAYLPQNPNAPFLAPNHQYYHRQPQLPQSLSQRYFHNPNSPFTTTSNNPYLQSPPPPAVLPNPSPLNPQATLDRVEAAAAKAHRDLVAAGESISAWTVAVATLLSLKVASWSSLGFQLQDVPTLHKLLLTEGKVNAFIHCFVGARWITSLYDLDSAICKNERIERFEELGLGPLSKHPLARHYFSIPLDTMEVFKITSEDIIASLKTFMERSKKRMISAEKFLDFLVEQKSVSGKEQLGIRIQSIGLHISYIREATKEERASRSRALVITGHNIGQSGGRNESDPPQPSSMILEKQVLDERFDSITDRFKSFSSGFSISGGKHIRFDSSSSSDGSDDSEDNDGAGGEDVNITSHQNFPHDRNCGQRVSSCPYPSTSEEMMRLGLKSEMGEKVSPDTEKIVENESNKSSGKKRKFRGKNDTARCKYMRKQEVLDLKNEKTPSGLCLSNVDRDKFITTWKDACCQHSVPEVMDMMLNFYDVRTKRRFSKRAVRRRERLKSRFTAYPGIGLLNVAVISIKCGMLDSLYDTFQVLGEREIISPESAPAEMIEIKTSTKEDPVSNVSNTIKDVDECGYNVNVDDIIKKVAQYYDCDHLLAKERVSPSGKHFSSLKKFEDCEIWLATQFSVKEFRSLGHGTLLRCLEKHVSLLPYELYALLSGELCMTSDVGVSMPQQQLGVLLSQIQSNLMGNGGISKSDFSAFLKKQFPTTNFDIVGNEPEKWFIDLIKSRRDSDKSNCVLYSATLLGKPWTRDMLVYNEKLSAGSASMKTEIGQRPLPYGTISSKDAIECLLKAPMMSDLLAWSHWDLLYAPSLGPLTDWLLNEVNVKELVCIATIDGKLIRIDQSATVDEFLEAMIQCSSFQVALKFLSLLYLYGGTSNAPLSLLKRYSQRAIDVIIRNSVDSLELVTSGENLMHKHASKELFSLDRDYNFDCSGSSAQENKLSQSLCRINTAFSFVSRFILECLGYLPSEFRSFASDILVSGLRTFAKDAHMVILHECTRSDQRLMLHDIGLSSGITEWIEDYHKFSSTAAIDLFISSKTLHKTSHSLCPVVDVSLMHTPETPKKPDFANYVSIVADAQLSKGNHEVYDKVQTKSSCDINQVHNVANSENSDKIVEDATLIIESIRRDEFGLDPSLSCAESGLLKKQHARLGRALHCLSQELYSQDSHLLLELVQNADDNIYPRNVDPTLVFVLQDSGIVVLNNERGFSAENIRALCDIGNSTKKGTSAGYIGHKGIGFKSVFRVTDAPEIHSNGFHVKFDITEGQIGFVLPTVIPPRDVNKFMRLLPNKDPETDDTPCGTCILLPFRSNCREGTGMNSIISMFSDLHPSLLLFLHKLRCIKFKNMLNDTLVTMRREILRDGIVKVSHGQETMSWLVISKNLQASVIRPDVQTTEIAMAFTLQESENGEYQPHLRQQPVFAFLPLRNYGLKFILQADFVLPSSREEVDGNSAWNQWLLSEFPALFVSAGLSFCQLPCFQNCPAKAVTAFMSFVPLVGDVHGFFSHLPHLIISKLRMSNCLLLDGPCMTWVLPCRVLRGWNEQARMLIPEGLLQKHLGLGYLSKDVKLSDALSRALGIQDYGPRVLTDVMSSLCRTNGGIQSLGIDWLSAWLATLYSALSADSSGHHSLFAGMESDLFNGLKKIPFIPLSDGSYSSVADGPIWLPCDALNIGFESKHKPKDFPSLYAKLRTVNPLLLAAASTTTYKLEEASRDNLIYMLQKIGVQQLSAHEVIKSHILRALSEEKYNDEDKSLMVECLSFILIHFQHDCASCQCEKEDIMSQLRKRPILLTNHGYRCPNDEPIHFGKEYKNPIDVDKLIDMTDLEWLEVDVTYLKHPSSQSLSSGLMKWRNFFEDLGVTDFVQVTSITKNISDMHYPFYGSVMCDGDLIAAGSSSNDWESPELVNLLKIFSSKKFREKCIYLLQILDKLWDDCYSSKAKSHIITKANEDKRPIDSSFMKSIREIEWIASTTDQDLHHARDLFYDCEEVRSVLGNLAPYAVPQVNNKLLLKEIGIKTTVSLDDALTILHAWRVSNVPFMASISQMSRFYSLIFDGLATSKAKITEEFTSSSFIFIPFLSTSKQNDVVSGAFLCPKEVYWHDPTGCLDKMKELLFQCPSTKETNCPPCKSLATLYPSLRDFFVNICGVHDIPPFCSYLQILLQLSSVALPSQAAHVVFRVFLRWAEDIVSGLVKPEEILDLKNDLLKLENTVLPTEEDKWVSLHPSFGLVCWSDDEELKQHLKHSDGVNFLQFGELCREERELLSGKIAKLMHNICVPALSEVVSREAIFYGTDDSREKASLINWVLPYAQRYLYKLYPDVYDNLKQNGFEKVTQLQVVVVDKLFYKYFLKGHGSTSKKRFECCCLLQGNILYLTRTSDSHSIFLELSRLFFNASAELHFANFLHMVTTMAESGSTNKQTEFFIVNSQKISKLPDEETAWCLSSLYEPPKFETQPTLASPTNIGQNASVSQRKPGPCPNWPSTDWKSAPDFDYARRNHYLTRPGVVSYGNPQKDACGLTGVVSHVENQLASVEIDGGWTIEEGLSSEAMVVLQDPVTINNQPCSVGSLDYLQNQLNFSSEQKRDIADSGMVPGLERDVLHWQTHDENQLRVTGKLGEIIAYKYFVEKLGSGNVKWVNEDNETGLPYDLITGEEGGNREYIEVKATRSASKDWFPITTREWQFASEKGDLYSIAHVILLGPKKASISVLKNPLRLCQQNALHLAVLMSRQLRDSSVTT